MGRIGQATPLRVEGASMKERHGHLNDVGLGSLVSYFFCVLASVSIRPNDAPLDLFASGNLGFLLAFMGASCLTLLVFAISGPYVLRHDNPKVISLVSCALMTLAPLLSLLEGTAGGVSASLLLVSFFLSGCGYALCLIMWGRILSIKDPERSSRQIFADTCAAIVIMVAVALVPNATSAGVMLLLAFAAGLVCFRKAVPAHAGREESGQLVVSDTRSAIPRSCYFVGGMPWVIHGVFLTLLSDIRVFDRQFSIAAILVMVLAAVAGFFIVRLHRKAWFDLSRVAWVSVPLLVAELIAFASGDMQLLKLAVVLILVSVALSHLHLMVHFTSLAHRPNLLSDQLFAWGWLAPSGGMFVGLFAGIACRSFDDFAIKSFLSIVGALLVVALIVSMRSIESIKARRRELESNHEGGSLELGYESRMDRVFSELGLSARESEVASLMLQGHSQAAIAAQLFVAASTVNTHVKHIYRKAAVRSKQEFIDLCRERAGLVVS